MDEAMAANDKPFTGSGGKKPVAYRRLMAASMLCMIMFGAVLVVPPVCLEAIGRELQINYEARGVLIAVRMAALIISLLIVGTLGEGPYKRHYLLGGLMAIGLSQAWGAQAPRYALLWAAMALSGLGKGVVEALVNPLVAQLNPTHCARALNIVNGLFSVGLVIGALSTGFLLEAGFSWRLAFAVWIGPPWLCALLFYTPHYPKAVSAAPSFAKQKPLLGAEAPAKNFFAYFASPLFWALMMAMLMGGGCEAGLTSWAANFVSAVLQASPLGGAWTTAIYGSAMALGRFGSGWLVTRWTPLRLMALSAAACGAATFGLAFVSSLAGAYALFALGGLFVACFWPTLLSVASDHISAGSTALFAWMATAGVAGCMLFPWLMGRIGDLWGLRAAMLVLPASMIILLAMLGAAARLIRVAQQTKPAN